MTNSSNTRNDIELNDEELEEVTAGWGPGWSPGSALLPVSATSPAAAATLSAIQPIHLAPLPALHTAVPHL